MGLITGRSRERMEGWREDGGEDGMMEGEIEGTEDCIEVGWKEEGSQKGR